MTPYEEFKLYRAYADDKTKRGVPLTCDDVGYWAQIKLTDEDRQRLYGEAMTKPGSYDLGWKAWRGQQADKWDEQIPENEKMWLYTRLVAHGGNTK